MEHHSASICPTAKGTGSQPPATESTPPLATSTPPTNITCDSEISLICNQGLRRRLRMQGNCKYVWPALRDRRSNKDSQNTMMFIIRIPSPAPPQKSNKHATLVFGNHNVARKGGMPNVTGEAMRWLSGGGWETCKGYLIKLQVRA